MTDNQPAAAWDYDRGEIVADGIIHAIGVAFGAIGAIALVILAVNSTSAVQVPSILVYVIGLLSMLGFSAAYNMWPVSRVKWILRRFDHSAIFVMIAGTYTPFLAQMKSNVASVSLFIGVWLMAVVGIALKTLLPGRFERAAVVLCLLLGWSGALAYEAVASALPSISLWLLGAGGALYSTGVVFHAWRALRFQNAIWHLFVLLAACCHYSAVVFSVANAKT